METLFYINLNIKTITGHQVFGKYYIGNDREVASAIFTQLKGSNQVGEENVLQLDFIEKVNGLPVNIQVLGCTLSQLSENCGIITREIFKMHNLK